MFICLFKFNLTTTKINIQLASRLSLTRTNIAHVHTSVIKKKHITIVKRPLLRFKNQNVVVNFFVLTSKIIMNTNSFT